MKLNVSFKCLIFKIKKLNLFSINNTIKGLNDQGKNANVLSKFRNINAPLIKNVKSTHNKKKSYPWFFLSDICISIIHSLIFLAMKIIVIKLIFNITNENKNKLPTAILVNKNVILVDFVIFRYLMLCLTDPPKIEHIKFVIPRNKATSVKFSAPINPKKIKPKFTE